MKKILFIITAFLYITSTVFPQSKININRLEVKEVEVYRGFMFKVTCRVGDDVPYTGKVFDLYESTGKKKLQGQYEDGYKDGKWTYWYDNGQKEKEEIYDGANGTPQKRTYWHENGEKSAEQTYKGRMRDGLWTSWYENGQKKTEGTYKGMFKDGLHTYWGSNGHKIVEGNWKNGKRDGLMTTWINTELGSFYSLLPIHKEVEGTYKDDKKDGLWTYWSIFTGQKKSEENWKDGELNSSKCWDEDGNECECFGYGTGCL